MIERTSFSQLYVAQWAPLGDPGTDGPALLRTDRLCGYIDDDGLSWNMIWIMGRAR
jgi:hypothetical protein